MDAHLYAKEDDYCWRCGEYLQDEELFMGLCDECLDKELTGIVFTPKKRKFDDEE